MIILWLVLVDLWLFASWTLTCGPERYSMYIVIICEVIDILVGPQLYPCSLFIFSSLILLAFLYRPDVLVYLYNIRKNRRPVVIKPVLLLLLLLFTNYIGHILLMGQKNEVLNHETKCDHKCSLRCPFTKLAVFTGYLCYK